MNDQKYFVWVYPKGPEKDGVKLQFDSNEEKQKYIKAEYWFCKDVEDAYLTARTTNKRKQTKEKLYEKRVSFARKSGFVPSGGNIWKRVVKKEQPKDIA